MKNFFQKYWPSYFGAPTADHIDATALTNAQSHLAQLLNDADILAGQVAGYRAIIERLGK
jgi:hypothetical protein